MIKQRLFLFVLSTFFAVSLANCGSGTSSGGASNLADSSIPNSNVGTDIGAPASPIGSSGPKSPETQIGGQSGSIPGAGAPGSANPFSGLAPSTQPANLSSFDLLGMPSGHQFNPLISDITKLVPYLDPANKKYFPNPDLLKQYYCSIEVVLGYSADRKAALVEAFYLDVLGRLPDPGGFIHWIQQLSNEYDASNRETVAKDIQRSDEDYRRIVNLFYTTILERAQSAGDGEYWLNRFRSQASMEQVLAEFHAQNENYVKRFRRNPRAWVRSLYRKVLGRFGVTPAGTRDIDSWEISFWVNRRSLRSYANRTATALEIINSFEAREKFVETMYAKYLGRAGEPAGLQAWTAQMMTGGLLRFDVEAKFLASDEYFNKSALTRFLTLNSDSYCQSH